MTTNQLQTSEIQAVESPTDLAHLANEEHRQCEAALQSGLAHALAAGEYLAQAKGQVPHGEWLPRLEDNFEGSERTAQAYMRVAREWPALAEGKAQRVADLPFREAVRLLAAPSESHEAPSKMQANRERLSELGRVLRSVEGEAARWAANEMTEILRRFWWSPLEVKQSVALVETYERKPGLIRERFEAIGAPSWFLSMALNKGYLARQVGIGAPTAGEWREIAAETTAWCKWLDEEEAGLDE